MAFLFASSGSLIVLVLVVVLVLDLLARERYHPVGSIGRRTVSVCSVLKEQSGTLRLRSTTSSFRGVAGVQELKNLGFRRRFSRADACPGFSDKDLARIFCNSCNS